MGRMIAAAKLAQKTGFLMRTFQLIFMVSFPFQIVDSGFVIKQFRVLLIVVFPQPFVCVVAAAFLLPHILHKPLHGHGQFGY